MNIRLDNTTMKDRLLLGLNLAYNNNLERSEV